MDLAASRGAKSEGFQFVSAEFLDRLGGGEVSDVNHGLIETVAVEPLVAGATHL